MFMEKNGFYDPAWIKELPEPATFIINGLELLKTAAPESDQILTNLQGDLKKSIS
jgi:hypothetical protein